MTFKPRDTGIATIGTVVFLAAGAMVGIRTPPPAWPSAVAQRALFADTLVETGTLTAQQMHQYGSTISAGPAKIVALVPEGTEVVSGDVLIRFDAARFEDERQRESAALRQAETELVRAIEDARLDALRGREDLDAAQQQIANAERGLANESSGKGQVAIDETEAAFAEADRELTRARAAVEDLRPLLAEKFITRAELEHAEQALQRAADQRRLAATRRDAMLRFERPAAASRAQAEVHSAREALLRQSEAAAARSAQRRASISAVTSRIEEQQGRVASLTAQIARATVRADSAGLVVYRDFFFGTDRRKPAVGDEAFPNQPIVALPDSSQMIVESRVREVDLHKVSASQRVTVRVDAYPDLRLGAAVSLIGALASDDATRAGTRWFPVTVKLTSADPRLRTGMTARVEIEVASLPSAVVVPLQAVFDDNGSRYVVSIRDGRPQRRIVTIAAENDSHAAIASGLAAGERVLLIDPTGPPA